MAPSGSLSAVQRRRRETRLLSANLSTSNYHTPQPSRMPGTIVIASGTSMQATENQGKCIMGVLSDIGAGAAVVFSAYSLWQTSLKRPALKVFVSPVIRYASPYQNSNFEAFAIPLTVTNEGAQTGTVLSMDLVVKNPERSLSKRFFSADVGQWSVEKAQKGDFTPFAPIVLSGRSSHTDTILFQPWRE